MRGPLQRKAAPRTGGSTPCCTWEAYGRRWTQCGRLSWPSTETMRPQYRPMRGESREVLDGRSHLACRALRSGIRAARGAFLARLLEVDLWREQFLHFRGPYWVREGNGTFEMFNPENRVELFALPMSADGSVAGEIKFPGSNRPWRVIIPAGSAPRDFDILDLAYACRYRMEPM